MKPELALLSALHRNGLRFVVNRMPPDMNRGRCIDILLFTTAGQCTGFRSTALTGDLGDCWIAFRKLIRIAEEPAVTIKVFAAM
ncbi:hypothetical protein AB0425_31300 [Actinosynnema sp. NPDC051121]